jgi:thiol:disulfide interchange protein
LPLIVLHGADGKESARVTGFMEPDAFLALMRKAK